MIGDEWGEVERLCAEIATLKAALTRLRSSAGGLCARWRHIEYAEPVDAPMRAYLRDIDQMLLDMCDDPALATGDGKP